jgi:hypothetical protein
MFPHSSTCQDELIDMLQMKIGWTVYKLFKWVFRLELAIGSRLYLEKSIYLTEEMTDLLPLAIAYCVSCQAVHFEPSSVMIRFFSANIRIETFKLEIPTDVPKLRGFWEETPHGRRPFDETPQRHILGRNRVDWSAIYGTQALGVGCALAQQNTGKNFTCQQLHPYGEPRIPPPIIMNFGLLGSPADVISSKNSLWLVKGFLFSSCKKWPSRVGAVALYTVLWTKVTKYMKWPFSATCRTKPLSQSKQNMYNSLRRRNHQVGQSS